MSADTPMSDDHTYVVPAGPHDYALLDRDIHGPLDHSTKPLYHTNTNYNNMSMDGTTNHSGTNGHAQQQQAMALQIKKLSPNARAPTRGSKYAAGYDIYAAETKIVPGRGKAMIGTGIAIAVPVGTYGRIAPRSGLASKHSLSTGAGVIDYDYRGEVKVLLFNHSDDDFTINEGDRMAQLVLERIVTPEVVEVQELEDSERGAGGFGSTGGFAGGVVGNVGV